MKFTVTVTFTHQGFIVAVIHNNAETSDEAVRVASMHVAGKWDKVRVEPFEPTISDDDSQL